MEYIFLLGRKPLISLAEILSVFPEVAVKYFEKTFTILDFGHPLENAQIRLNRLGGTRMIAEILGEYSFERMMEIIKNHAAQERKKIIYSGTALNLAQRDELTLKNSLKKIKKNLNEQDIKSRYQEKFLGGKGLHFAVFEKNTQLFLAKIIATQDFRAYSERDYEKPFRDSHSGMLPPKLAQIMINLSGVKKGTLYDPFCGSGTILMEGKLLGFDVIGSDIDEKTIEGAKRNLHFDTTSENQSLFVQDATKLQPSDVAKKPDTIISESYLGPFFREKPTPEKIAAIQKDLEKLYAETLKKLREFNVPIVLALPCHKIDNQYKFLPNVPKFIQEAKFEIRKIFPSEIIETFIKKYGDPTLFGFARNRKTLLYDRPDQNVAREIFMLDPKEPIKAATG